MRLKQKQGRTWKREQTSRVFPVRERLVAKRSSWRSVGVWGGCLVLVLGVFGVGFWFSPSIRSAVRERFYVAAKADLPQERTFAEVVEPSTHDSVPDVPTVAPVVPPVSVSVQPKPPSPVKPVQPNVSEPSLPDEWNLAVPFTSQAPKAVWDEMHEETCEEASVYMVQQYFAGTKGVIDVDIAETELLRLVDIQKALFGYFEDTTVAETVQFFTKAYGDGYAISVLENPTQKEIQQQLVAGFPVLFPAAGKLLKNPHFRNGGPPYHLIVVRGYTANGFITNDPGTRYGEGYVYPFERLMTAMHDWNADDMLLGAKRVFVVKPRK